MIKSKTVTFIAALVLSGVASAGIDNGLTAYYPFNGNANDESGNKNHGIVSNAVLTTDKNGSLDSAYKFDGDGDSIILPNNVVNGLGNLSFSAWVKIEDTGDSSLISGANVSGDNEMLVFLPHQDIATIKGVSHTPKATLAPKKWYHILFTRNGVTGVMSMYFNGVLDSTATLPAGALNVDVNGLLLGREQDCVGGCFQAGQDFNGIIDEVRVYNRILSPSEIKQLYFVGLQIEGTVSKKMNSFGAVCENLTTGESVTIPEKKQATQWNCEKAGLTIKADDKLKITIEGSSK
ncbi:MAG: LamG domain-containing protein [Methylovulum sp.]|nr:LamG domain-containing protein [Methylovulum sp.]MCF7998231.1 LamG domain-containing protein [Methylovulum sp.]